MFLGKEVRVLLREQAKECFIELKKRTDKERAFEILKDNPQFGDPIGKDKIPKDLIQEGITNIYRLELSNYWRMIYTLSRNKIEVFCFILNIVDHPTYDKIFGYRGK
ncbi:MAG: hypothetical protein AABX66_00825 [Nanoarchaeota archaeon]